MRGADDLEVVHMGERTRYEPGTFCWVGLATSDPGRAKAFYTGLFGWHAEDLEAGAAGAYTTLRHGGRDVATLYLQQPEARAAGAPPHWTSYISVEDAEATAALAGELGGAAVFRAPFDVLDAGRVAAIRDPTGAIVSLWQPRALIGATLVNDVGALCWNELATTDVERPGRSSVSCSAGSTRPTTAATSRSSTPAAAMAVCASRLRGNAARRRAGCRTSASNPATRRRVRLSNWTDTHCCRRPKSTLGASR
jgi:predicted enzyme related to lactoylglutathione lyase